MVNENLPSRSASMSQLALIFFCCVMESVVVFLIIIDEIIILFSYACVSIIDLVSETILFP